LCLHHATTEPPERTAGAGDAPAPPAATAALNSASDHAPPPASAAHCARPRATKISCAPSKKN
jgi:hypothetical protein